jgi:hypothetical protein
MTLEDFALYMIIFIVLAIAIHYAVGRIFPPKE